MRFLPLTGHIIGDRTRRGGQAVHAFEGTRRVEGRLDSPHAGVDARAAGAMAISARVWMKGRWVRSGGRRIEEGATRAYAGGRTKDMALRASVLADDDAETDKRGRGRTKVRAGGRKLERTIGEAKISGV